MCWLCRPRDAVPKTHHGQGQQGHDVRDGADDAGILREDRRDGGLRHQEHRPQRHARRKAHHQDAQQHIPRGRQVFLRQAVSAAMSNTQVHSLH